MNKQIDYDLVYYFSDDDAIEDLNNLGALSAVTLVRCRSY